MKNKKNKKREYMTERLFEQTCYIADDMLSLISAYIKQTNDITKIIQKGDKDIFAAFVAINTIITKLVSLHGSLNGKSSRIPKNGEVKRENNNKLSNDDIDIMKKFLESQDISYGQ